MLTGSAAVRRRAASGAPLALPGDPRTYPRAAFAISPATSLDSFVLILARPILYSRIVRASVGPLGSQAPGPRAVATGPPAGPPRRFSTRTTSTWFCPPGVAEHGSIDPRTCNGVKVSRRVSQGQPTTNWSVSPGLRTVDSVRGLPSQSKSNPSFGIQRDCPCCLLGAGASAKRRRMPLPVRSTHELAHLDGPFHPLAGP